jgi:uncharacterized protein (TIGR02246 family)
MTRWLVCALLLAAAPVSAQTTPAQALTAWATAYAALDGEMSAAVYAPDARLWGTVARTQTVGRDAIRAYFDNGRQNLRSRVVTIGEHAVQQFGGTAVASGHYRFQNTRADGTSIVRAARFSMTIVDQGGRWLIVNHHSSTLPDAPAPAATGR